MELQSRSEWKLMKQGAEARVYRCLFFSKPAIVKERFPKSYRLPELDKKLTHRRMSQEVRSMARCRRHGIRTPAVYHFDPTRRLVVMEMISEGTVLKDYITSLTETERDNKLCRVAELIGTVLAQMHDIDVIHGDLTTSNMIYDADSHQLTLIDFGLSYVSGLPEDKGVDLYVLERALLSTHPQTETQFQLLIESYTRHSLQGSAMIKKLDEVRMRGRKRTMVG